MFLNNNMKLQATDLVICMSWEQLVTGDTYNTLFILDQKSYCLKSVKVTTMDNS